MTSNLYLSLALSLLLCCLTASVHAQTNPNQLFQRQQPPLPIPAAVDTSTCLDTTSRLDCPPMEPDSQQPVDDVGSRSRSPLPPSFRFPTTDRSTSGQRGSELTRPVNPNYIVAEPPTEFQRFVQSSTGHLLPLYGAWLFEHVPSTFAPGDRIPVTPDYVVGPGDEIELRVWGQVDFSEHFTIDRTGNIFLPQVGRISLSGLRFTQLQGAMKSALGRVYRNFDLNVNMGQLRSMQIFILGQARRPGSYTVSSLSTLVNALFASGGPSSRGSLRGIQLKRGSTVVTNFDLYDLLLQGDKTKDVPLLPGDVIFIPDTGPRVALDGSVGTPAIFELKADTSLGDVLGYAGGLSSTASAQRVILERIDKHAGLSSAHIDLSREGFAVRPQDGDIIRVLPIVRQFSGTVTLRGNVADSIRFPWRPGLKVSALIPSKDVLLTRNYWSQHNDLMNLNMDERAMVNAANAPLIYKGSLKAEDGQKAADSPALFRDTVRNTNGDSSLAAAVDNAPASTLRQFARTYDVQPLAPAIDWTYASIERLDPRSLRTEVIPFNLGKAVIEHDPSADLILEPGDIITIFSEADISLPKSQQTKYVRIEGEVAMAGVYSVKPGETLRDVVIRAGGLTPNAYLFGAQLTRESTRREQQRRYTDFLDQLEREVDQNAATVSGRIISADQAAASQSSLSGQRSLIERLRQTAATGRIVLDLQPDSTGVGPLPPLPLENGDRLYIPSMPSTVNVVGMVYNQSAFIYDTGYRLIDYLSDAGGPSHFADRSHMFVIRADGSVVSREMRPRLLSSKFDSLRIYPGDTLVVPMNVNKTTLLRGLVDWSQVVSNFGLGVAAINVLK